MAKYHHLSIASSYYAPLAFIILVFTTGCGSCSNRADEFFVNNPGTGEIGIIFDGSEAGMDFIDRELFTTPSNNPILAYDATPHSSGRQGIAAFTERKAPAIFAPTPLLEGFNLIPYRFGNEFVLDFTVWIVDVEFPISVNQRINQTMDAFAWIEERWRIEKTGLRPGRINYIDATNNPNAQDYRDFPSPDDVNAVLDFQGDIRTDIGFVSGQINIYLIRKVNNSRFFAGSPVSGDQIFMGMRTSAVDLLFHETSHCFCLSHVDSDQGFDNKNVQWALGNLFTRRKYFSEGQTFRVHADPLGAINTTYGLRPNLYTVTCGQETTATVECPALNHFLFTDN